MFSLFIALITFIFWQQQYMNGLGLFCNYLSYLEICCQMERHYANIQYWVKLQTNCWVASAAAAWMGYGLCCSIISSDRDVASPSTRAFLVFWGKYSHASISLSVPLPIHNQIWPHHYYTLWKDCGHSVRVHDHFQMSMQLITMTDCIV